MAGKEADAAVHGLRADGVHAGWWEDSPDGATFFRGGTPLRLPDRAGLVALDVFPGPTGSAAVLHGYPGGDYGLLSDGCAPDSVLARRPTVVWFPGGFAYTGFPGHDLDNPPAAGQFVGVHGLGRPFADDRRLECGPDALISLEATADPATALVRVATSGRLAYRLLRNQGADAVLDDLPLDPAPGLRTRMTLGAGRWWRGEHLGTSRAQLLATSPGTFAARDAVPVALPEGTAIVWFWATRGGIVVRAMRGGTECLYRVDNATLEPRLLAGGTAGTTFPEVAATPAAAAALWLQVGAAGTQLSTHDDDAVRVVRSFRTPRRAPGTVERYRTRDEAQLPVQLSGTGGPVVLLEHGGLTALASAPLERALERLALAGEITLARAVTRSLRPAARSQGGRRAYDDLLAASEWLASQLGPERDFVVLGHSMGAIGAARALLMRPELFVGGVLRFPVCDLVGFPELGIGRHWLPMLGDPADPDDRTALSALSPLQLPVPEQLPPLCVQVGRHDTRADPRHGRRFAAHLAGQADVQLVEYAIGHVERFAEPESRRAVADVVAFVRRLGRSRPPVLSRTQRGA